MHLIHGTLLFLAFLLPAWAADDLTAPDIAYLNQAWGAARLDGFLGGMSPVERTQLHALVNDPATADYTGMRDSLVFHALVNTYARECKDWAAEHRSSPCPPIRDTRAQAGKNLADQQCHTCHLFGTADAPSFVKLAGENRVNRDTLAAALESGHRMSPITLGGPQLDQLNTYIQTLR